MFENSKRVPSTLLAVSMLIAVAACGGGGEGSKQSDAEFAQALAKANPSLAAEFRTADGIRAYGKRVCASLEEYGADALIGLADAYEDVGADEDTASDAGAIMGKVSKRYCPDTAAEIFE